MTKIKKNRVIFEQGGRENWIKMIVFRRIKRERWISFGVSIQKKRSRSSFRKKSQTIRKKEGCKPGQTFGYLRVKNVSRF